MDGSTLVVGASGADIGGLTNVGAVYVSTRAGTIWTEQQRLSGDYEMAGLSYVGLAGDLVVAGASTERANQSGGVYVYRRSGTNWTRVQRIGNESELKGRFFGIGTSTDGTSIPPTNLTVGVAGDTATFTWAASASGGAVANYVLVAGVTPGFTTPLASLPLPASSTTTAVPGIPPGTHYVRVVAQNAGGVSAATNEAPLTVAGPSAPGAPTLNTPTVSGNTVTLSWTPGGGGAPTLYVPTARASGGAVLATVPLSGSAVSFGGVPSGTYLLSLVAVNSVGASPPSSTVTLVVP